MIRRTLATAAAVVGIAALLPLTASAKMPVIPPGIKALQGKASAQVAGACTLSVPNRIAIGSPGIILKAKVAGPCSIAGSSSVWELHHPSKGDVNGIIFDTSVPTVGDGTYAFLDDDPLGNQVWQGRGSINADQSINTQNNVPITVKLAAGAWISSSRKGDVVTLKGTSLLYSTSNDNYFKRSAGGVFQFRERGTTTWKTLKSVYTNSKGEVTMAYRYSKVRDYRFSLYSTSISWDLGSAVTTR